MQNYKSTLNGQNYRNILRPLNFRDDPFFHLKSIYDSIDLILRYLFFNFFGKMVLSTDAKWGVYKPAQVTVQNVKEYVLLLFDLSNIYMFEF